MADVAQEWTPNGLATELNLDRKTIVKKLAGLEPVRVKGRAKYYLMRDVFKHFSESSDRLDFQQEQAKLSLARREKVEIETAQLRRVLINADEVARYWFDMVTNAKTKLLAMPKALAHQVIAADDVGEAESILKDAVRQALEELAKDGIPKSKSK